MKYPEHSDFCAYLHEWGLLDDGHRGCISSDHCVAVEDERAVSALQWLGNQSEAQ